VDTGLDGLLIFFLVQLYHSIIYMKIETLSVFFFMQKCLLEVSCLVDISVCPCDDV
jgi:hypothetical protein